MGPSDWGWKVGQTCSSDDRQMFRFRCTDADDPLQLFGRLQYPKVYLQKACRKHGLECTSACRHCQDGNCDNMTNDPVIDDDKDDV